MEKGRRAEESRNKGKKRKRERGREDRKEGDDPIKYLSWRFHCCEEHLSSDLLEHSTIVTHALQVGSIHNNHRPA